MIGTDIIEIDRIEEAAKNPAFLQRVFLACEIEYIKNKNNAPQTIAGLFAAKEAVIKACGGKIGLRDICITHDENGMPIATVGVNGSSTRKIYVSISHCKTHATAVAIKK